MKMQFRFQRTCLLIFFLSLWLSGLSQNRTKKYNEYLERYEYFNAERELIGYSKWNDYLEQWEYTEVTPNKNDYEYVQPIDVELVNKVLAQKQRVYNQRESIALETMKTIIHQLVAYYKDSSNLDEADEYFSTFFFGRIERFENSKGRYDFSNDIVYEGWINTLKEAYIRTINNVPIKSGGENSLKPKTEAKPKLIIRENDVEQRKFIDSIRKKASKVVKKIESNEKNDEGDFNILNLDYLKGFDGQYKFKELVSSEPLSKEIKKLYGKELFEKFLENIEVQTPVRVSDNQLMVSACQAHSCSYLESALYIDLEQNLIFVGLLDKDQVHIQSNSSREMLKKLGDFPPMFKKWTNDAYKWADFNQK